MSQDVTTEMPFPLPTLTLCAVLSPSGKPMALQAFLTVDGARKWGLMMVMESKVKGELQPTFKTYPYVQQEQLENVTALLNAAVTEMAAMGEQLNLLIPQED